MNNVVEFSSERADEYRHSKNRRIGNWLTKLASFVTHSREFREKPDDYRKTFWAELVLVMAESDLPDAVWSTDAIRFCRRKFKFFPSAAELCEALSEYAEPIRAAARERWEEDKRRAAIPMAAGGGLTSEDQFFLGYFRKMAADDFRKLANDRGTNPDEARHSALPLLKQQSRRAYDTLSEAEKRDTWRPKGAPSWD